MLQQLIQDLMSKLGISEAQAKGGLALLLKTCQEKLAAADFSKLTKVLGDNWQELLKSAPPKASGFMSSLGGGIASMLGEKGAQLSQFANVISGFKSLNIDSAKITQFLSVVSTKLQEVGGPQIKEIFDRFLNKKS